MRVVLPLSLLLTLLPSCRSAPTAGPSVALHDLPPREGPVAERLVEARRLVDSGELQVALELAESVLRESPGEVDAHRLRQDVLRRRGRLGLLLHEAEQRLRVAPDDVYAHYLMGRIAPDQDAKYEHFRRAVELDLRSFWAWLGLAFAERDHDVQRALDIYKRLLLRSDEDPLVTLGYGSTLRDADQPALALVVYSQLRESAAMSGLAEVGIAGCFVDMDLAVPAWRSTLEALRLRPDDPAVYGLLSAFESRGLPPSWVGELLDVLGEAPDRIGRMVRGGGGPLLARLAAAASRPGLARRVLADAAAQPGASAAVRRDLRRLQLSLGDVSGWLDSLRLDLPTALLTDPSNQVRGRWLALWGGPWTDAGWPVTGPRVGLEFLAQLADCGLLRDAEAFGSWLELRWADDESVRARVAQLRRDQAFLGAVQRELDRAGGDAKSAASDVDELLERLREVSQRILGRDVVGVPTRHHVPFTGELLDPFGPGLPAWFRGLNLHLVVGARSGAVPEGMAFSRLSLRDLDDAGPLPMDGPTREVIGEERQINALRGMLGGDLAGVALFGHYVIDFDAVRSWTAGLIEQRRVLAEDGGALLDDPLPDAVDMLEPVDASWRLLGLSPLEDSELLLGVLDTIRWHERAHLADSFRYLPPERRLLPVLGLLFRNGFQPIAIESELEGRAETAALAFGRAPRVVLAHIANFLAQEGPGSPHARGFRELARDLCEAMKADPELGPYARVSRWHLAPPARLQELARQRAGQFWALREAAPDPGRASPATSDTIATKIR